MKTYVNAIRNTFFVAVSVVASLSNVFPQQHLNFIDNIKVSPSGNTNDLVADIIEANNKIFVYSSKTILVFNNSLNIIDQIDLPGYYGKFNPIFAEYNKYISDIQLMTYNEEDQILYAVTPDIGIIAINTNTYSFTFLVDPIPDLISHFQVLNGYTILKFDASHDRLYWLVEGRNNQINSVGNFHTRDTYLALYEINDPGNAATLVHEYFDEGVGTNYNNTISDVEFTSSDYFFVARKKHIDVYDFTDPEYIYITFQTIPGKFGKLMYEPTIDKIIALPYRLPFDCNGTCEPPWSETVGFYFFDATNPQVKYSVPSPSKRISDGYYIASKEDLILCYANDEHVQSEVVSPGDSDVAIYNWDGNTFTQEQTLLTDAIPAGLYSMHFDMNRPRKICYDASTTGTSAGVIISKVHELTSVKSINNNPYNHEQIKRGDGNVFSRGIGYNGQNYILNSAYNGIEVVTGQTVVDSTQTGLPVYNITTNPLGRKLYLFNKFHSYNSNLIEYDMDNGTLSELTTINQTIGDCVYNPYENHILISEGGPLSGNIKVFNANDNTLYQDITISDDYVKEMFLAPDQKLYVLANMYNEDGQSPQLYIFRHDDATGGYEQITVHEISMPPYENEFLYYVGNFCYVPPKQSLYVTISPNDTTLFVPYQPIQNTLLGREMTFSSTNSVILEINNDQIVGSSQALYARKMICPDAIHASQTSQYNDKLYILAQSLLVLDYTQPLSSDYPTDNPNITSIQLEDATYSDYHDKLFGFQDIDISVTGQALRKADIKYIDGSGNSESLVTGNHCDGLAAGIFYNPYDHYLYLYKWIDNPKLGNEQSKLLCFDPSINPADNCFVESVDLQNITSFPEYCNNNDAHMNYCHITDHYIDPYDTSIYISNGGNCNVSKVAFVPDEIMRLDDGDWNWISFPRMDREDNNAVEVNIVLGGEVIIPNNYEPGSELINLPLNDPEEKTNTYTGSVWAPTGGLENIRSTLGYKLYLKYTPRQTNKWLHLYGSVYSPGDPSELPTLYAEYPNGDPANNWIGYYYYQEQHPLDAISEADLEDIYSIQGQNWTCGKFWGEEQPPEPYWLCACSKGKVRLNYGDLVILKTQQDINNFQWQIYGMSPGGNEEKPETTYYTYEEQADYTALFVELDTTVNPQELGAFIEDTCIGATSVSSEDTLVMVPAYSEGYTGEISFQIYYGSNKSFSPPLRKYWVMDQESKTMQKRAILTQENEDYYFVSFREIQKKINRVTHPGFNLRCIPNPARDKCRISFQISAAASIKLVVYDIYGRPLQVIQEGKLNKGSYQIQVNVKDIVRNKLNSGIYFVILECSGHSEQVKLVLVK